MKLISLFSLLCYWTMCIHSSSACKLLFNCSCMISIITSLSPRPNQPQHGSLLVSALYWKRYTRWINSLGTRLHYNTSCVICDIKWFALFLFWCFRSLCLHSSSACKLLFTVSWIVSIVICDERSVTLSALLCFYFGAFGPCASILPQRVSYFSIVHA